MTWFLFGFGYALGLFAYLVAMQVRRLRSPKKVSWPETGWEQDDWATFTVFTCFVWPIVALAWAPAVVSAMIARRLIAGADKEASEVKVLKERTASLEADLLEARALAQAATPLRDYRKVE